MSTDTICSGGAVTFQAQDQGMATYQWNFGSGSSPGTANGIGPHTVHYNYNATNGSIGANVTLTVSLPGCVSANDTVANIHLNAMLIRQSWLPSLIYVISGPGHLIRLIHLIQNSFIIGILD